MIPDRDLFGYGPNAQTSALPLDRDRNVSLSLLQKIRGKSPGMRAIQFLALLRVPEGKKAGKQLKLANFQRNFVKGAFANGVTVGVLSIGRGNAKTALSAGLALAELVGALQENPQPNREIIFAARNRDQARIRGLNESMTSLFEVIYQLAEEVERDIEHTRETE